MDMHEIVDVANDPRFLLGVVPAGNIVGTAREASRFMEVLRCGGTEKGVRLLRSDTVGMATARLREGMKLTALLSYRCGTDSDLCWGRTIWYLADKVHVVRLDTWGSPISWFGQTQSVN